jgi:hypothetical protein
MSWLTRLVLSWWGGSGVMLGAMALAWFHGDWTTASLVLAGLMMFLIDYLDRVLAKPPGTRP